MNYSTNLRSVTKYSYERAYYEKVYRLSRRKSISIEMTTHEPRLRIGGM
jgi:hypothetical protein